MMPVQPEILDIKDVDELVAEIHGHVTDIRRHVNNAEHNIEGMNKRIADIELWLDAAKLVGGGFILYLIASVVWHVWKAW